MDNNKTKKFWGIILDVILALLVIIIIFVSISSIISQDKGYTAYFGTAVYAAKSDSMKGTEIGSFDKNALIFSAELKTNEEKKSLEVGDVITYFTVINGVRELNTHRIVSIVNQGGANQSYMTRGDNAPKVDPGLVLWSEVVSVYKSKVDGIGAVVLFAQSSMGFFIMVLMPSVLIFIYCIYAFATRLKAVVGEKAALEKEKLEAIKKEEERIAQKEAMRKELLAEMEQAKKK